MRVPNDEQRIATEVDWQCITDLPAILKLDLEMYKEDFVGDLSLYVSWARKNPYITLISFERGNRDNVLAYLSLVPLPEPIILAILRGEKQELSIEPDEVESYDRTGAFTLLAESIVVHPDHPEEIKKIFSAAFKFWCDQYPERYIEKIYADAVTDHGCRVASKLYFSPLYNISDRAYVLDLRKPGISILVRRFQECLKSRGGFQHDDNNSVASHIALP